jgi:hypothetical protein
MCLQGCGVWRMRRFQSRCGYVMMVIEEIKDNRCGVNKYVS